ncbi:MAG: uroporphyrinogen-III C-methyltransferase [Anaerolineae bacterium]|nr:uroporphyrinogen-III C-methyltransferase [Anaerolineae bacterium]
MKKTGIVYLIGAGPGDPGLITVRGRECLVQADVVVYDHLVGSELLDVIRSDAERIYAGKLPDHHTLTQEEINAVLVEKAQAGLKVARLKGGDPFVFGRGGEEALALVEAGLPFEVVPGVTSAIAVPAYAGIPVTHRGVAASFAVITGHRRAEFENAEDGDALGLDWEGLAGIDTLVFLMGLGALSLIAAQLLKAGRSPETPVASIRWGTTPDQEVVTGTLVDIAERVKAAGLRPPAITVVGEVAALREKLCWFDARPLFGRRVLVTRASAQASRLSAQLRQVGANPVEFPTISINPPEDWGQLDAAIERLSTYDWVIFTSANGVRFFWERLEQAGKDARAFAGVRLAVIGPATAEALKQHGLQADLMPEKFVAEAILEAFGQVKGQHILLPRADIARETLAEGLVEAGAQVDEIDAYHTGPGETDKAEEIRRMVAAGDIDVITFTSSSTVRNFVAALAPLPDLPESLTVACIGPITADTAREVGLPVHVVAEDYTIDGLVESLVHHFAKSIPLEDV